MLVLMLMLVRVQIEDRVPVQVPGTALAPPLFVAVRLGSRPLPVHGQKTL